MPGKEAWVLGDHLANTFLASEFDNDVITAFEEDTVSFEQGDEMKQFLDLQNEYSVQLVLILDYSPQVEDYFSLVRVAIINILIWYNTNIEDVNEERD